MTPVLLRLRWMLFVGKIRKVFRDAKKPKGIIFGLLGGCLFLFSVLPNLLLNRQHPPPNPENVQTFAPIIFFVFCLPMFFQKREKLGILFQPAEIDFLFPAPLSRRNLILYKLTGVFLGTLLLTALFTLISIQQMPSWFFGWLGMYCGFVFINLLGLAIPLIAMTATEGAYSTGKRIAWMTVALLALLAVIPAAQAGIENGAFESFKAFRNSFIGRTLFAPFEPFGRLMSSSFDNNDGWLWLSLSIALNALVTVLILRFDTNFLEASAANSQRIYNKLQRMKRGGAQAASEVAGERTRLLPMPPHFRGGGPIFWQQMTSAVRQRFGMKVLLLVIFSAAVASFVSRKSRADDGEGVRAAFYPIIAMMVFTVPSMITFDFRAHLERLDWLKTLPVSNNVMFAAQIATPVIIATTLQVILVLCAVVFFQIPIPLSATILAYLFPANVIMIGFENIFFLLFPIRMAPGVDFQGTGRNMIVMFLKFAVLLLVFAIVAGFGGLSWLAFGRTNAALLIGSWVGSVISAIAMIPAGGIAWHRLDPASDMPA